MKSKGVSASALLVLILVAAGSLPAQTADTANLRGVVEDKTHLSVVGATISVSSDTGGVSRSVKSGHDGSFAVFGLPVSTIYEIRISASGFAAALVKQVQLTAGSTVQVHVELAPDGGNTTVNVFGTDGLRSDQPQLGSAFVASQIASIPSPSSRITYLPLLNAANRPAINQGDIFLNQFLFTTNGTGRRQTYFVVDGANGVDSWGRQTIFATLPQSSVEQMTVLTSSFSAQYGFGAGSLVNIVTARGTDKLHGNLLGMWRPSATEASLSGFTAATAPSGNALTSDVMRQVAASLSGPIGNTGKTQFLGSFEHSRQSKDSPVTSPFAPGIFTGHYRGWLGFLRFDRQIGGKNSAFLRLNSDLAMDTNPNGTVGGTSLPSVGRVFRRRTYSAVLGDTTALNDRMVNNLRLQFQLASPITQFSPSVFGTQYVVPITSGGTFTAGTSQSALLMNRQFEISEALSLSRGSHQIAIGASILHAHSGGDSKEFGGPLFLGRLTYNTCSQAASVCQSATYLNDIRNVANYQQSFGNASYTVDDQTWAAFVQDDVRISSRFFINAGLRYERQTFTDATKNFSPRLGLVLNVDGRGT